jgi:uroporphyrin-III C-methyltransferase/precorrin-2 dehydrogenase/sirohydrochlorin ferrochelatase
MPQVDTPYLAGLDLRDRRVVVVGGGLVAQRRLPTLLDVGARVELVSPEATPAVEGMAQAGELHWHRRRYADGDLAEAWYVLALTDDVEVNAAIVAEATRRRIFCVRADDGTAGTASTPASAEWHGLRIAVASGQLSRRPQTDGGPGPQTDGGPGPQTDGGPDPLRAASVRDGVLDWLRSGAGERLLDRPGTHSRSRSRTVLPGTVLPGVALVGGGPGDPELITVRGRRLLGQADVVVVDRLGPRTLLGELGPDVEVIDATKLPRGRFMAQEAINDCLVEHALAGKFVVRLKGGDPYVFGRGSEEVEACVAAGVPVTVVPGLSSAIAVPALAGIPLTHRGVAHEAVIVSGHLPPGHPESLVDWTALGRLRGTVVVLMGVQNLPGIAVVLRENGRPGDTPVAVVQDGSMPAEKTTVGTLDSIAGIAEQAGVRAPAIIVIGGVVAQLPVPNPNPNLP